VIRESAVGWRGDLGTGCPHDGLEQDAPATVRALHQRLISAFQIFSFQLLPDAFDVGVEADDDGFAVDLGFGGLVAPGACDGERLAGGGRARRVQRDFDVEDVVLDGGFHFSGLGVGCALWGTLSLMVVFMVDEFVGFQFSVFRGNGSAASLRAQVSEQ